jgi:hypothetical protein
MWRGKEVLRWEEEKEEEEKEEEVEEEVDDDDEIGDLRRLFFSLEFIPKFCFSLLLSLFFLFLSSFFTSFSLSFSSHIFSLSYSNPFLLSSSSIFFPTEEV